MCPEYPARCSMVHFYEPPCRLKLKGSISRPTSILLIILAQRTASIWPFLAAMWSGPHNSLFLTFGLDPEKTKLSAIALNLLSLLMNTFITKCSGVLPSLSTTLGSAFRLISMSIRRRLPLTTARWRALPKRPPPWLTSEPASIRSLAISG